MNTYKVVYYLEMLSIPLESKFTVSDIEYNHRTLAKIYHLDMNEVDNSHPRFIKIKKQETMTWCLQSRYMK